MDEIPSISSSRSHGTPEETGMEQVQTDMQALKRLYELLNKGPSDENLDKTSNAYLRRILDEATQKALKRQIEMISGSPMPPAMEKNLSIRSSDRRTRAAEPSQSMNPPASPSLSLHNASERLHRLNLHRSPSSSSRDGGVHGQQQEPVLSRLASNRSSRTAMPPRPYRTSLEQSSSAVSRARLNMHHSTPSSRGEEGRRRAAEEPHLSRVPSNRSSRTAAPPPHHPRLQHLNSGQNLNRFSVSATSQHGTVTARSLLPPVYDRSDQSSLERRNRQRSASRQLSRGRERPGDHATAEGSSSTARHSGRLGSGLSVGVASRRGSERARRGGASPRYSSSASNTIRSRIRRHRERSLLRRAEEEGSTPRMRREEDAGSGAGWSTSGPRRALSRVDSSSSTYNTSSSSGAASSSTYTSPTSSSASASSSPVPRRRRARPAYASDASRSTRRGERKERREGRLRRLTKKIAMVFHHRHDHHHHHHHYPRGRQEAPPPKSDRCALNRNPPIMERKSPWKHLGGMFHRKKGRDKKKAASHTTVSAPAKKHGGGHMFGGAMRHFRGKRKAAPASVVLMKMASRVQVKKKHWWPPLKKGRGKQRHRLGHGKA